MTVTVGSPASPRRRFGCRWRSSHDGNGGAFGSGLGAAEQALDALEVERFEESADLYLLFKESDATVKIRHGVLDIKGLLTVDEHGLEQWAPVAKHRFPVSRDDVATALARLHVLAPPPLDRETYTPESSSTRWCDQIDALLAVDDAQAAHAPRRRRLHGRDLRDPHRRGFDAFARARVRGSRPRDGGPSLPRPRRARERVHGPRAEGADRLRDGALRRDRCGHELRQAPCRRSPGRRHVERDLRPGDRHATRRGPRRDRLPRARADGPDARRDRGLGRRGARGRRDRDRGRRHRRAARRDERGRVRQRRRVPLRRPDRDHPRRGGGAPRVPRGHAGLRLRRRLARGLRHRRRQLPVHLR